jgi:hypothetical protein
MNNLLLTLSIVLGTAALAADLRPVVQIEEDEQPSNPDDKLCSCIRVDSVASDQVHLWFGHSNIDA